MATPEAQKNIMESLAGIDDELNELRRKKQLAIDPHLLPVSPVIVKQASSPATEGAALGSNEQEEQQQPQDMGGLLLIMIKKLNQNEKG